MKSHGVLFLAIGIIGWACAGTRRAGIAIPRPIPSFNRDSLTRDSTGKRVAALVGIVVDSASGSPVQGAGVSLRSANIPKAFGAYTNDSGVFVIGRVQPDVYEILVRRVGYHPHTERRNLRANTVDTLRVRLSVDKATLYDEVAPPGETSRPQYLTFRDKLTATVFSSLRQDPRYKIVPNGTPFVCPSKTAVGAQGYLLSARVIKMKGDSAIASITRICSTAAQTTTPTHSFFWGQSQMWTEDFLLMRRAGKWQVDKPLGGSFMIPM